MLGRLSYFYALLIVAAITPVFPLRKKRGIDGPDALNCIIRWLTNAVGHITYLDPLWYKITGGTPETELGLGAENRVHPEDQQTCLLFRQAHTHKRAFCCEYRLRTRSRRYIRMWSQATPVFVNREFIGFCGVAMMIPDDTPPRPNTELAI